jgi:Na+/H+ antiporter NhaD/arsenite permease-like protein
LLVCRTIAYLPKMIILKYTLVILTYTGLGLGYLPGLRMNRAAIALTGATLLMAVGVLNLKSAWSAIDYKTLTFLFSMMVINASLSASGFFQLALDAMLRFIRSPLGLLVIITLISGIFSALFLNDTIALIFTPLVLELTQALKLNPVPYLLALAGATNLGSVATLSGNPQNILIGSFSGISYLNFAQTLVPLAMTGLFIQIGLLYGLYPEVRSLASTLVLPPSNHRLYKPLLIKSVVITVGLLVAFLSGVEIAEAALIAASLILISRRIKTVRFLYQVDWNLLVMFSGLFILTEEVQRMRLFDSLPQFVHAPLSILGVTVLLSNIVSNVPAVLLLHHLIPQPNQQTWFLLAAGSTLAGNLTLLGSVANLIVAEAVSKQGQPLTFGEHFRFGLPLTLCTLAVAYFWLT